MGLNNVKGPLMIQSFSCSSILSPRSRGCIYRPAYNLRPTRPYILISRCAFPSTLSIHSLSLRSSAKATYKSTTSSGQLTFPPSHAKSPPSSPR